MKATHIVFKTFDLNKTKEFWETVLLQSNRSQQKNFLSYDLESFIINFEESENHEQYSSSSIGHLGIELKSQAEVRREFDRISKLIDEVSGPFGGEGRGLIDFILAIPMVLR